MSLIEAKTITTLGKNGQSYNKTLYVHVCDFCHKEFLGKNNTGVTYCTKKCLYSDRMLSSKRGREIAAKNSKTHKKLYDSARGDEIKRQISESNIAVRKNGKISARTQATFKKKYGVSWKEYVDRKFQDKYGVKRPSQLKFVKEKLRLSAQNQHKKGTLVAGIQSRYGVDNAMQIESIKTKQQDTTFERFGVRCVLQLPWIKSKVVSNETIAKRHKTMKENGTYQKSKPEDMMYEALVELFGEENVARQHKIENFSIDFFIKPRNLCVQVDGSYWHGTEKTFEELYANASPRTANIILTKNNDRKQNTMFLDPLLPSLLRIDDKTIMRVLRTRPESFLSLVKISCDLAESCKVWLSYNEQY